MKRVRKVSYSRKDIMNRDRVNAFRNRKKILRSALNDPETRNTLYAEDNPSISDNFNHQNVRESLRSWVNCHGIAVRAVNDLLKILVAEGIFSWFFLHIL